MDRAAASCIERAKTTFGDVSTKVPTNLIRVAVTLTACAALAACARGGAPDGLRAKVDAVGRWAVTVSVEPEHVGPITVSVGAVRRSLPNDAGPWLEHNIVFSNTSDRLFRFADTRTSAFIGPPGDRRRLLAADEGCGYVPGAPDSRLEAGACRLYLDAFVVRPQPSVSRTVTLFKGLPGMKALTARRYTFEKLIRFGAGREIPDERTGRAATLRLVYDIRAVLR